MKKITIGLLLAHTDEVGKPILTILNDTDKIGTGLEETILSTEVLPAESFNQAILRIVGDKLGSALETLVRRQIKNLHEIHEHIEHDKERRIFLLNLPRSPLPLLDRRKNNFELKEVKEQDLTKLSQHDHELLAKAFKFLKQLF